MECEEGMRNKQKKNHFSPISAFKRKIICNVRFFPMLKKKILLQLLSLQKKKRKRIQLTKQINFFSEKKNQTKIRQNNKKKKTNFSF